MTATLTADVAWRYFEAGYRAGRLAETSGQARCGRCPTRIAVAAAELAALPAWPAHPTAEAAVRLRLAELERCAERVAAEMGRPAGYRYDGGPVAWETGYPAVRTEVVAA